MKGRSLGEKNDLLGLAKIGITEKKLHGDSPSMRDHIGKFGYSSLHYKPIQYLVK